MWTVVGDAKSDPSKGGHAFLILSRYDIGGVTLFSIILLLVFSFSDK